MGAIWPLCSLNCLVNDDFCLFGMLLHSKYDYFTSTAPIPMGSLDPPLSGSHITGNARFIWHLIVIQLTEYCIPPLIQTTIQIPHNTYQSLVKYHNRPPIAFQYPIALYLWSQRLQKWWNEMLSVLLRYSTLFIALKMVNFAFLTSYFTLNGTSPQPDVQSRWDHLIHTCLAFIYVEMIGSYGI